MFPAEVPLMFAGSLSNSLENVYEPSNCKPLLSRLVTLISRPLYQDVPSDSTNARELGATPCTGVLNPMFARVFEVAPRIGFEGEADNA